MDEADGGIISSFYWEEVPLVRSMLAHSPDCNATDRNHQSALHYAIMCNHLQVAQLLLEHGANINQQDSEGETPLMWAITNNHVDMTRLLLGHGADVSIENEYRQTALHYVMRFIMNGNICCQLLAHGAAPNHLDKDGITPLLLAQQLHRPDLVALPCVYLLLQAIVQVSGLLATAFQQFGYGLAFDKWCVRRTLGGTPLSEGIHSVACHCIFRQIW